MSAPARAGAGPHPRARRAASAAGLLLAATVAGCGGFQSALRPAGPQAGRIATLWWIFLAVTGVVFVLVLAFLFVGAFRRRGADEPAETETDPAIEKRLARVVAFAVGITVVILLGLLVADLTTGRALASLATKDALTIHVTGHQWWWEVRYESPDPHDVFTTANEIHIPVGRPVKLELSSADVIHSLWVPNLHGKRDLIPGYTNDLWIEADHPGAWRGQCAEFCGLQHANMSLWVVAEEPAHFRAWLAGQRAPAVEPTDPLRRRGETVFLNTACVLCHTVSGTPAGGKNGPDLTHLASRRTLAAGMVPNTRGNLGGWITNPDQIKPGNHMAVTQIDARDLQALIAYLEGLR